MNILGGAPSYTLFLVTAAFAGTVFGVSLLELIFTVRRRKQNEKLKEHWTNIRTTYNQTVNKLVLEEEAGIQEAEKLTQEATAQIEVTKQDVVAEYELKMKELDAKRTKQIEAAKARAKELEKEAKQKAEDYLASRKEEVEQDLMNLVISVTKKVIPESLSYEVQEELVLQALRTVQAERSKAWVTLHPLLPLKSLCTHFF